MGPESVRTHNLVGGLFRRQGISTESPLGSGQMLDANLRLPLAEPFGHPGMLQAVGGKLSCQLGRQERLCPGHVLSVVVSAEDGLPLNRGPGVPQRPLSHRRQPDLALFAFLVELATNEQSLAAIDDVIPGNLVDESRAKRRGVRKGKPWTDEKPVLLAPNIERTEKLVHPLTTESSLRGRATPAALESRSEDLLSNPRKGGKGRDVPLLVEPHQETKQRASFLDDGRL